MVLEKTTLLQSRRLQAHGPLGQTASFRQRQNVKALKLFEDMRSSVGIVVVFEAKNTDRLALPQGLVVRLLSGKLPMRGLVQNLRRSFGLVSVRCLTPRGSKSGTQSPFAALSP